MSKKGKRYVFHSAESPEELLKRIEEGVSLYNTERYGRELKFERTEKGFRLEVMRANYGTHYYEAEVYARGGTQIDGWLRYVKDEDNFSKTGRFFHWMGLAVFWISILPVYLLAACIIIARLRAHNTPITKKKTLLDFMENFVFCEWEKEESL